MGNTKQALRLITEELKDVEQAIIFAKEHDDVELWQDLIDYSMDKPRECHQPSSIKALHLLWLT